VTLLSAVQYLVLLYTSNPSRGVSINCNSTPTLFSYAVPAELHGITLKDRNLNAEHLGQFHTHSFDQHLRRQNHAVTSELRHCSVKFNKQQYSEMYVCFASNVRRVADEVNDVTSVNTMLQQCTEVVRRSIQFEITYSTSLVEFSTTMTRVVLMERCNFVSAGTLKQRDISRYRQFIKGFRTHIT
jgi:hypothetical protein